VTASNTTSTNSLSKSLTGSTTQNSAGASSSSDSSATDAATLAATAAQNAQLNSLTNSGRGSASTGASVSTALETMVPLASFSKFGPSTTPLAVNPQGPFVATTFSFNLPDGEPLSVALAAVNRTMAQLAVPTSVHGTFARTANLYQASLANEPILILASPVTIYIVLGMLYESYVHPLTILSTLPSAGVGAVLALLIFRMDFSLIGLILLIGIVKKNAIIMIDFAIDGQRHGLNPRDATYRACLMRFRPIMMTIIAAIMGGIPLAVGISQGSELRQPLGIAVVGGLVLSQALTLYTTPIIYLYLDRCRTWIVTGWGNWYHGNAASQNA
jgi:multidrug efflux pump